MPTRNFDRRAFLKIAGVGTAVAILELLRLGFDSEVRVAIPAALSRHDKASQYAEALKTYEVQTASEEVLKSTWENHFNNREDGNEMTLESWSLLGQDIASLTNLYYPLEQDKMSFDQYFSSFVNDLHEMSNMCEVPFSLFAIMFDYPATSLIPHPESQVTDVDISSFQEIGGAIGRHYGIESIAADQLVHQAPRLAAINPVARQSSYFSAPRLLSSNPTTGILDYEIGDKASALVYSSPPEAYQYFRNTYPDLFEAMNENVTIQDSYEQQKQLVRNFVEQVILTSHGDLLQDFFKADTAGQAFQAIGIGDHISSWQKVNYTTVWHTIQHTNEVEDSRAVSDEVVKRFQERYQADPKAATLQLCREQLLNPRFTKYLRNQATQKHGRDSVATHDVKELEYQLYLLDSKAEELRISNFECLAYEGEYEFDKRYQAFSSASLTKMFLTRVENEIGPLPHLSHDTIASYGYAISCLREIGNVDFLISNVEYPHNNSVDDSYTRKQNLTLLTNYLTAVQQELGIDPLSNYRVINPPRGEGLGGKLEYLVNELSTTVNPVSRGVNIFYYGHD